MCVCVCVSFGFFSAVDPCAEQVFHTVARSVIHTRVCMSVCVCACACACACARLLSCCKWLQLPS